MPTRIFALLTGICAAIAVVMVAISGILLVRYQQFDRSSVTAPGTVVEMVVTGSNCPNGGSVCDDVAAPRVTFTPPNGDPSTFLSRRSSGPPEYVVGDGVTVRYLASDLTTARIDSDAELLPVVVVGGIGIVFLAFGLLWFGIGRKSRGATTNAAHRLIPAVQYQQPQTRPGGEVPTDPTEPPAGCR